MRSLTAGLFIVSSIGLGSLILFGYLSNSDQAVSKPHVSDECRPLTSQSKKLQESGRYCLTGDLALTEGLVVAADFVTIDLAGHELSGPLGNTETVGISAVGVSNFRVANGRIRGFGIGVDIYSDREDHDRGYNEVDSVTIEESSQSALHISGRYSRILNSSFKNIGGGPLLPGVHTHGVFVSGPGAIIQGNSFENIYGSDVRQKTEGIALAVSGHINGALVANNTFQNDTFLPSGRWAGKSPSTYAVWLGGNGIGSATVFDNTITNYVNGVISDYQVTAIVVGNHMVDVAIPVSLREARRKFGANRAAGAKGYTPSDDGKDRPFGAVVKYNNRCETQNETAKRLSTLKTIQGCIADYDISFDELMASLR